MTTFSRILINPNKRGGMKLLRDPQSMHAAVLSMFPPDLDTGTGRVLWRVDSTRHDHVLYVVAPEAPDADHIVEQAGWSTRPAQSADYSPLLARLQLGQEWQFRFRGNPVRAVKGANDRGVIRPHVTAAQQTEWFLERAENNGFTVELAEPDERASSLVRITDRKDVSFRRGNRSDGGGGKVTLRTAQFDGTLKVSDTDLLRNALVNGIGRGKAYGCGLMTLRRG